MTEVIEYDKTLPNVEIIKEQEVLGKNFKIYGNFEKPLFLAKDVAEWIEHSNSTEMLKSVDNDEKIIITPTKECLVGLQINTPYTFLTENGLYEVLMQSRKPIAKEFKKQVKEILNSIRRRGTYTSKPLTPSELMLAQAQLIVSMERKQLQLESNQDEQHKEILKLRNTINRNITSNNFTIIAYANLNKIKASQYRPSQMGRYASKLCREKGFITGVVVDSKYGAVKTYPMEILEETFKNFGL